MTLNIQHDFVDCKEEKSCFVDGRTAVVALGTSGSGKSSILRLFCGDAVAVGHGTSSQTTESTLHADQSSAGQFWLDSQGANDSSGTNDRRVLTDLLHTLYVQGVDNARIMWCVSGDMHKAKFEFQTQAKFIQSLGPNVWASCLIIKKRGASRPKNMAGVLEAGRLYGSNIQADDDQRLFGYTGLEFKDDPQHDSTLQLIMETENAERRNEKLRQFGYLNNADVKQAINAQLDALPSMRLQFNIRRCTKCDARGDPRFVFANCHGIKMRHHPQPIQRYHPGGVNAVHVSGTRQDPITQVQQYHPGHWKKGGGALETIGTFGLSVFVRAATNTLLDRWTCCRSKWRGQPGCASRTVVTGHATKWSCCNQLQNAAGCQQEYSCCRGRLNSVPCRARHACCQANEGATGCQEICQSCQSPWARGPGCTATHD